MRTRVALALAAALLVPASGVADEAGPIESGRMLTSSELPVPIVRQKPERCGPAALEMVMGYWNRPRGGRPAEDADAAARREAEAAYDPTLRGALITELAAAARRAGFDATVETPSADSLAAIVHQRVPPILLVDAGIGPVEKGHYVVVVAWDERRGLATIHDGGPRPRVVPRRELVKRWQSAGGQALIVRPR